jgi:large subunit ribosomal protein L15
MKIHQLEKSKWLKDKQRRRGRWNATWTGNYSSRGLKWQKARSGSSRKAFFEWGQTSIVQRLPKARGFKRYYKFIKDITIINLGSLDADARITDGMAISKEVLKELWYIKKITDMVKILWNGDYAKKLTFVEMNAISASAQQKIDAPGTVHSVPKKAPVKVLTPKKPAVKKPKVVSKVAEKTEIVKKPVVKKAPAKTEAPKKPTVKKAPTKAEPAKKPAAKKPAVKKTK